MKRCCNCQETKELTEFSKKKSASDGLNSRCKICTRLFTQKHYQDNKEYYREKARKREEPLIKAIQELIQQEKDKPCKDCGRKFPPWCMDFDHLDNKEFTISQFRSETLQIDKIKEEIAKCEVVCAVCHRDRTYKRRMPS